jgi:maltose phosphorylase
MNRRYKEDEWLIIEEGFHPGYARESESIFSIGNGYMGQRANFEEKYSGDSLQGSYIAGVYYPDKTRVGWWKNGYPEYFAKVLNAPSWIGIGLTLDDEEVDLAKARVTAFTRILDMREGFLERRFRIQTTGGTSVDFHSRRFLSMAEPDLGIIKYSVMSVDYKGKIGFNIYLDSDVRNEDTNYGRKFWKNLNHLSGKGSGILVDRTLKTNFHVATGMCYELFLNGKQEKTDPVLTDREKYVANSFEKEMAPGDEYTIIKYASVLSSLNIPENGLVNEVKKRLSEASAKGYDRLFVAHRGEWETIWNSSDIVIEGDVAAQQAIRFNIFQLNQTYTGKDERLNIGPKGFTGEKYGGSTYWDTEAFVLPFFLKTAKRKVPRNLLIYRYKHLQAAILNAAKLGFTGGAALYPMVTMNGEECHNEWEITFEEIHRNGAIAFAIYNYIRHTGDYEYLADFGLEVLTGISRFWSQRASWSENMKKFVILGVTGPNEYENNVNNNWYTNTIAVWTMSYTLSILIKLRKEDPAKYLALEKKTGFMFDKETARWKEIIDNMHFPYYKEKEVFLQQDCFLDKEIIPASEIPPGERPVNQHWSWDRILRSCYIKQADVLQGLYVFEENYDTGTLKRNFDFYEPITVHESSLSACIHSILASRIGYVEKAYELYLRTSRLDLDDYNNEVGDGLHITSMAGTWLAIVEGFGGMRIIDDKVCVRPLIPVQWKSYSFHARFRGVLFEIKVAKSGLEIHNHSDKPLTLSVSDRDYHIKELGNMKIKFEK